MAKLLCAVLLLALNNDFSSAGLIQDAVQGIAETSQNALESTVDFVLFSRDVPQKGVKLEESDVSAVDPTKPIKFIVHGYLESANREWYDEMTAALLRKGDFTVIQVNWDVMARKLYTTSVENTKLVGERIGNLIVKLHNEKYIPLERFHVIGHSLGGHVGGFAGKTVKKLTGQKFWKITGLDAAGPLFETPVEKPMNERLSYDDAEIVENVHTDGGVLGYKNPLGTLDYFANGGTSVQPGCDLVDTIKSFSVEKIATAPACSHTKSHEYYTRAINGERIPMYKCPSWNDYKSGNCQENEVIFLGDDVNKNQHGSFYFQTKN